MLLPAGEHKLDSMGCSQVTIVTIRNDQLTERVLPAGEHKLSWSWVKDYSVSENDDRATLHQLLITGTSRDAECTPCPAGTCGNGGALGCSVCPKGATNPSTGAVTCQACEGKPAHASWTGPHKWPLIGNAGSPDTCPWGCDDAYSVRGPRTADCPDNMCCALPGACNLPSPDAVADGRPPATMQMLTNCLALTPIDQDTGKDTVNTINTLLGATGVYVNHDVPVEGLQTRGDVVRSVAGQTFADVLDTSRDPGAPKSPPPSTLDPQPSTLDPQPSTLNPQPSTLNPHLQPSTLNL
jgi:hypothetical protein